MNSQCRVTRSGNNKRTCFAGLCTVITIAMRMACQRHVAHRSVIDGQARNDIDAMWRVEFGRHDGECYTRQEGEENRGGNSG